MARGANLRLSSSVLGQLANPSFARTAGTAIGQAMLGPEIRQDKEEEQEFFKKLMEAGQEGNLATQGGLLATRGAKVGNTNMVLQGTQMMASANKQNALTQIDTLLDVYADPTKSQEERAAALASAEAKAYSGMVGMTPQSFNALVSGASGRYENTLNTQARQMAATGGANAIADYSALYGAAESWRINQAVKDQTAVKNTLSQQSADAFTASKAGEIVRLETQIAQYETIPVEQWDMDSLRGLYNQRFQIEQDIVAKGGQGDPSKFVGGAARFYDEVYARQSARKDAIAAETDARIENQRDFLYGIAKQQRYATSDQFIAEARKSPLYADWDESDWDSLESDIASFQEMRANKSEYIRNGKLAPTDEEWLAKYSDYFSDDDDFQADLKAYRAENTDNLTRLAAGNALTVKVREARSQQRQDSRSDKQIKLKATDFVEAFIGAGDPDDPRFDPTMPVEGGFMQGDSVYDVVRRLQLTKDERYDKLITKVGTRIKDNPNAKMRETVMDAFQELFIKTPGEAGVRARQEEIAKQIGINKVGIEKLKKDYEQQTGEQITDEQAAMMIQQQLADALAADAERMSAGIRSVRQQARPEGRMTGMPEATRGMDPVTAEEFFGGVGDIAGSALRSIPGGPPSRGQ